MSEEKIDIEAPFPLAYLDWCKVSRITDIAETENWGLVMEFGKIYSMAGGEVSGLDIAIALGKKL